MLLKKIFTIILSLFISILAGEAILRIKNYIVIDYDVEMWRYAKELKVKDQNPKINHTHKKNAEAILQTVNIRTNKYGQRAENYQNEDLKRYERSFLFLGSSITLGWGVEFDKTYVELLNAKSSKEEKNWIFVNGGIGNYNTERYVNNYLEYWSELNFTDIVINFFVNDTEIIENSKNNILYNNTHLGVAIWKIANSLKSINKNETLEEYYRTKYDDNYEGFKNSQKEIINLLNFCNSKGIKLHIVLIPDIHKTSPYPLTFIDKKISKFANINNIPYKDLFIDIANVENSILWNKYNDPHPNENGHKIFADSIYQFLNK